MSPRDLSTAPEGLIVDSASATTHMPPYSASDGDTKMQGTGSGQGFWALLTPCEQDTMGRHVLPRDNPAGTISSHKGEPKTHVYYMMAGLVKRSEERRVGTECG
jgi:hypothetical protein